MRARQVVAGLGWSTMATMVNMAAQFGFMALLARLLEPAAFGVMAMATVSLRFASYFAQAGAAQTLVQQPQIDRALTNAAFWFTLVVSMGLYALLALLAPWIAGYFATPELREVLWVFGMSLPLSALASLPMAMLRREGRFGPASLVEVLSYLLGYGITGTTLALNGAGVWSLVAAALAQQGLYAALAYALYRYPIGRALPCREALRRVAGQGSRYSVLGFLEFIWGNIDSVLVGRTLGQAALGLANRAQLLCNLPVEQAVGTATKVLFPMLSAMQRDRARVADGFLLLLLASGVVSFALSAGLCAAAADVVALLLGRRWGEAVPLVQVLALSVPPIFLYVACGITLDSLGATGPKLRLQAPLVVVKLGLLWFGVQHGLVGMAWAIVACEWLRAVLGLRLVAALLSVSGALIGQALAMLAAVGLTVYLAVASARLGVLALDASFWWRVPVEALAGLAALALLLGAGLPQWSRFPPLQRFDTVRQWVGQAEGLFHRLVHRMPPG